MKSILTVLAGMALAVGLWFVWSFMSHEPQRRDVGTGPNTSDEAFQLEVAAAQEQRREEMVAAGVPAWMVGRISEVAPTTTRPDGVPNVMGRIEMLTWGRNVVGANTVELKLELLKLREDMLKMTDEEASRLAEYFANSDDPTTKYFLLMAFRSWGGEPYVDVVRDYYEAEPDVVGEALAYMMSRTPRAVEAFEALLREEFDPLRRANLVSRAGFAGAEVGTPLMKDIFDHSGRSADRRLALWGLARTRTELGKTVLWDVVDGPREEAVYVIGENPASEEEMTDLRCHAVLGLLLNGSHDDIMQLFERAKGQDGDVGYYVDRYFSVVPRPEFVPDVVDLLVERKTIDDRYLVYLANQAKPEHSDELARLLELDVPEASKSVIQELIDRMN